MCVYILGGDVEMHVPIAYVSIADASNHIGAELLSHHNNTFIKLKKIIWIHVLPSAVGDLNNGLVDYSDCLFFRYPGGKIVMI